MFSVSFKRGGGPQGSILHVVFSSNVHLGWPGILFIISNKKQLGLDWDCLHHGALDTTDLNSVVLKAHNFHMYTYSDYTCPVRYWLSGV